MKSCCNRTYLFFAIVVSISLAWIIYSTVQPAVSGAQESNQQSIKTKDQAVSDSDVIATFGAGCFWCVEAVFQEVRGVKSVESGFMGGTVKNPTYEQISTGRTGHAEVCRIVYDPEQVRFEKLLEIFWKTHDPTTLNRQGADYGPQYRSAIFYHNDEQKQSAETLKKKLDESGAFNNPIVTEITKASEYYPAEKYHQNFFTNNPTQRYCRAVIVPKMAKFRKVFADDLKN